MIVHLTAHSLPGTYPLGTTDASWRLWRSLRRAIKKVLAAHLMPNHLHIIAIVKDRTEFRRRVARVLAGFAKGCRGGPLWIGVSQPVIVQDPAHLARQLRYVLLQGTRAGYFDDPACAVWSTYRDVIGATLDPWVDVAELADALGFEVGGFIPWFHDYVAGDPSVKPGAELPRPAPPREHCATPLELIAAGARAAAATALGTDRRRTAHERHAFVLAARHQGWDVAAIAAHCGLSSDRVCRLARTLDEALLRVTAYYIGDERLLALPRFRRAA